MKVSVIPNLINRKKESYIEKRKRMIYSTTTDQAKPRNLNWILCPMKVEIGSLESKGESSSCSKQCTKSNILDLNLKCLFTFSQFWKYFFYAIWTNCRLASCWIKLSHYHSSRCNLGNSQRVKANHSLAVSNLITEAGQIQFAWVKPDTDWKKNLISPGRMSSHKRHWLEATVIQGSSLFSKSCIILTQCLFQSLYFLAKWLWASYLQGFSFNTGV